MLQNGMLVLLSTFLCFVLLAFLLSRRFFSSFVAFVASSVLDGIFVSFFTQFSASSELKGFRIACLTSDQDCFAED